MEGLTSDENLDNFESKFYLFALVVSYQMMLMNLILILLTSYYKKLVVLISQ